MRKIYTSFSEAAQALGLKVKKPAVKNEKTKKCLKCGGILRHIEGTNVYMCDGDVTIKNIAPDGIESESVEPCDSFVIAKNR